MNISRIFSECLTTDRVEDVWHKNASQIYKQCRLRSNSKEAADDLFQEVALKFCKSVSTLDVNSSLYSWFSTVIRNTHYELHRKNAKFLPISQLCEGQCVYEVLAESSSVHYQDNYRQMLAKDELRFFMEELNPEESLVVELTFLGGLSLAEASKLFGHSKNTLSKIRCTAVAKMRNRKCQRDDQLKKRDAPLILLEDLLTRSAEIS